VVKFPLYLSETSVRWLLDELYHLHIGELPTEELFHLTAQLQNHLIALTIPCQLRNLH